MSNNQYPFRRLIFLSLGAAIAAGCARQPQTGPSALPSFSTYVTPRAIFRYTALDATTIESTAAALDRQYGRITADLAAQQMPVVTVTLYPDRVSLRAAVAPLVGSIPAFANGLATAPDAIHVVSPSLASEWGYAAGVTAIVHEFAHCVTLRINPALPSTARWLWETVALYEAGQMVDPRNVPSLARGEPPALRVLSTLEDRTVYDVGGRLGEFIVHTWGQETLVALIRADGDILRVPGITESEFLRQWMIYLRERFWM